MTQEQFCLTLSEPTLQARHFPKLKLSARQLHLWLGRTGYESDEHESGKWRVFSPFDVLRLATLRSLKGETDLAISRHANLVGFLANDGTFAARVVTAWMTGDHVALWTDLRADHEVMALAKPQVQFGLHRGARVGLVMNLEPELSLMLEAVKSGGSDDQRAVVDQLIGFRRAQLGNRKAPPVSSGELSTGGSIRRGKRMITLKDPQ